MHRVGAAPVRSAKEEPTVTTEQTTRTTPEPAEGIADAALPRASADELGEQVREHYASAALAVLDQRAASCCGPAAADAADQTSASCCGPDPEADVASFGAGLYDAEDQAGLPDAAKLASLGCGNPTAVAELREGETVLDLGSGGGIDVLLSARRVGPTGRAIGLDMTDEMLELARRNAAEAGVDNVEFLAGTIEDVPLPDHSVDVVISNCVINLSTDKPRVFAELARVLRPGGRVGVSDIVAEDRLSSAERAERGSHVGCVAGALSVSEYRQHLADVGLTDVEVVLTHEVADGIHGAIVRARQAV
jgi:arsenite methyltransferase